MQFSRFITLSFLLGLLDVSYAQRSDSFSIVHTELKLTVKNFSAKKITGSATHKIKFKTSTNNVTLDLKQLKVDSVFGNNVSLTHTHTGEKLKIILSNTVNTGDSLNLRIHYSGTPAADPSGWGGFYFSGDYAFNLGVGFQVYPHSFGRAWLPCVDEFGMKTAYDMYIETDTNYTAACNGILISHELSNNSAVWHYQETVPISVYLASVSVSKFSVLKSDYNGIGGSYPIELFCKSSDTNKVKASFANLPKALEAFEAAFGPQPFSKVGYNFVPFANGAMEHAGNITYPSYYANGFKDFEELMAHELSHHWWGNQVTCISEAEMWLNEGWASYCEHFFLEYLYGKEAYKKSIEDNHLDVLRYAHVVDRGIYALDAIPETLTYGRHVYKKGADVIHSLRNIVGDSVFFKSCKAYQSTYRLKNASSVNMRDIFSANGGGAQAIGFFNHFIHEPGTPHVIISKQVHSGNGPFNIKIYTTQKPRFSNVPYKNLPVELFLYKNNKEYEKVVIQVNSFYDSFDLQLNFKPVYVALDVDGKLNDAITDANLKIDTVGTYDVPQAFAKVIVKSLKNDAFIRVEHHWVGPEIFETVAPYKSKYRYITVDGVSDDSFKMDLELQYDARQGSTSGTGYLDHTLIFKTEDSLRVMYRAFPGDYWREWKDLQFNYGNKNDKQGDVWIKNALKGDYVFAMRDTRLNDNMNHSVVVIKAMTVLPNPAEGLVTINFGFNTNVDESVDVYDANGKKVMELTRKAGTSVLQFNADSLPNGVYNLVQRSNQHSSEKLIINH
ncbi:MAG TPA: M1 family aminopeptidase [Bacteroidia bacterium]